MKEPRQKDRLEAELTSSCDKYGHSFGNDSERFPQRSPQSQTNAPLADRFGHICRSAELASTGDGEAGENGTGNRLRKAAPKLRFANKSGFGTTDVEDLSI
jgi:hypothetical protein